MTVTVRSDSAHPTPARQIGLAIVTDRHAPGTMLPGEGAMAEYLGVTRGAVRDALRTLAGKGLVTSVPRVGTRVRERVEWNLLDPELLGWIFEGSPPVRLIRSLFQLRMIVEPAAAELAATRRTTAQLAAMGEAIAAMERYALPDESRHVADQQFHVLILRSTQNEPLSSLSASIAAAVYWTSMFRCRHDDDPRDPISEHRALFDAIAQGDGGRARHVTMDLIRQAQHDLEAVAVRLHARCNTEPGQRRAV